jgi:hypothetical protein
MILTDILNSIKEKGLDALNNLPAAMRKEMLKNLATIAEHLPDDIKLQLLKELLANPTDVPESLLNVNIVFKGLVWTLFDFCFKGFAKNCW